MSGSNQHDRVALVSIEDHELIRDILNATVDRIGFEEKPHRLRHSEAVLLLVTQYTKPVGLEQRVCDHPADIIKLQKDITDIQRRQFLATEGDHTKREQ